MDFINIEKYLNTNLYNICMAEVSITGILAFTGILSIALFLSYLAIGTIYYIGFEFMPWHDGIRCSEINDSRYYWNSPLEMPKELNNQAVQCYMNTFNGNSKALFELGSLKRNNQLNAEIKWNVFGLVKYTNYTNVTNQVMIK